MEKEVVAATRAWSSRAEQGGTVTFADAADRGRRRRRVRAAQVRRPQRAHLPQPEADRRLGEQGQGRQVIADGAATQQGELALGKNVLVAFMPWDGYNFEDAIVSASGWSRTTSTRRSTSTSSTSRSARRSWAARSSRADIPNVSEKALRNLDETGIVRVGTRVGPGDILVGKVAPKSKSELTPEEKLLHAIFGRAGEDVKNDSLEVPSGVEGIVIDAQKFSRRNLTEDERRSNLGASKRRRRTSGPSASDGHRAVLEQLVEGDRGRTASSRTRTSSMVRGRSEGGRDVELPEVLEQIENFDLKWTQGPEGEARTPSSKQYWPRIEAVERRRTSASEHMKRGDELPSGVLEMVKVYVATKRQLSVGDKMAGRHGNKGVIAKILPRRTCRSSRTARRSTSSSTRWACPAA
jgi:DNA-directed RNA polymerase subunit beta